MHRDEPHDTSSFPGGPTGPSRAGAEPSQDDVESSLTAEDRRAIDAIKRELDVEYRPRDDVTGRPPRRKLRARAGARRSASPRFRLALVVTAVAAGGTAGGIAGWAAAVLTLRQQAAATAPAPPAVAGTTANGPATQPPQSPPRAASGEAVAPPPGASSEPSASVRAGAPDADAEVRAAFREWFDATEHRDIAGQMRFYPDTVPVFYQWRDASREAVRAEKLRVFGSADVIFLAAGPQEIEALGDGTVLMRFRKTYVIRGPRVNRRGEVLQELRWRRTADGWKIIGERDAAVLSQSRS
jgi:hypothetical protein